MPGTVPQVAKLMRGAQETEAGAPRCKIRPARCFPVLSPVLFFRGPGEAWVGERVPPSRGLRAAPGSRGAARLARSTVRLWRASRGVGPSRLVWLQTFRKTLDARWPPGRQNSRLL